VDQEVLVYAVALPGYSTSGNVAWVSATLSNVTDTLYVELSGGGGGGGYSRPTRHTLSLRVGYSNEPHLSEYAPIEVIILGGGYLFCVASGRLISFKTSGVRMTGGGHKL
jgi:hypothetical protein